MASDVLAASGASQCLLVCNCICRGSSLQPAKEGLDSRRDRQQRHWAFHFRGSVPVLAPAVIVNILHQLSGALHTNSVQFYSDAMAANTMSLLHCSETQSTFGTFQCSEHFSLAKAFHMAIMCVQLGNVWGVHSNDQIGMLTL